MSEASLKHGRGTRPMVILRLMNELAIYLGRFSLFPLVTGYSPIRDSWLIIMPRLETKLQVLVDRPPVGYTRL